MTGFQTLLSRLGAGAALLALVSGFLGGGSDMAVIGGSLLLVLAGVRHVSGILPHIVIDLAAGLVGMAVLLLVLASGMGAAFWWLLVASWLFCWLAVERGMMASTNTAMFSNVILLAVPVFFGIWIIFVWQMLAVGLDIPMVLLPSPAQIAVRFMASTSVLWADFQQTFLKAALIGYILGCGSAFFLAIIIDRVPFLQRGLLPVGNFVSALPVIGIAPIMVMWFGFDWQSKAAVVVVMTFFPMLVNTVAGLQASQAMERDLLRTYASSYFQLLIKLRLPTAAPFIFNALKINSTLALIGAIVAEFFGTPIVGLGFRISTEVGRMNLDMVWAEIVVAALAGSISYGLLSLLEKQVTFWHPSNRRNHS
ncbi:MAG TPA: nitrate ABC transporter [Alphaproteobacteria bacterium]|jgi:NitT/TauT family transport system permease protein|nr:nitrate ABC transporter [Alphaproteobacteria bacterium]HBP74183.1 nitrate ABC transporter [Alphaproteobacteria bacterium]HCA15213.1 nitrate ABC transporter [Alphaproteobacteria bacterium]HCD21712.1 nitrate ABC transporter [Alphaproteobacteria bacterium]HCD79675.1 nitrate ABC transporter [Alphaproteobacteria bacterium]